MKKFLGCILVFISILLSPSSKAFALEINVPVEPYDVFESDIFMTYEEGLELFRWNGSKFILKDRFKTFESKLLKERFYDRLYRIDGETYNFKDAFGTGNTYTLPVYTFGHAPIPISEGTKKYNAWIKIITHCVADAIREIEGAGIPCRYITNGGNGCAYSVILFLDEDTGEFDSTKNIGIAIKTLYYSPFDTSSYTYPTEDEYYAMLSGSSGTKPTTTATPKLTATSTPKPTATPTPEPTATPTPEPTATPMPEPTATPTPEPTATPTPEPTATPTPEPTATPTPEPTATSIPEPMATPTPELTATPTPDGAGTDEAVQDGETPGQIDIMPDETEPVDGPEVTTQTGRPLLYGLIAVAAVVLVGCVLAVVCVRKKKAK